MNSRMSGLSSTTSTEGWPATAGADDAGWSGADRSRNVLSSASRVAGATACCVASVRTSGPADCGRRTTKAAPPAADTPASTDPPCSDTTSLTIASPRPLPPCLRVMLPSACLKRSKMISRSAASMPGPLSDTPISTHPFSDCSATSIEPPAGVNLIAFDSRLISTRSSMSGSTSAITGPVAVICSRRPRCSAATSNCAAIRPTQGPRSSLA